MTIVLPSLSAGSSGQAYSAATVNAAINQQKTNIENVVNGIQGFDALLWNNGTATLASDTLSLASKPRALVIDTEGAAATDNLSTISNGTAYQQIWLKATNSGRVITVKHNVGNIKLWSGNDMALSSTTWLMLFYDGTQWTDIALAPNLQAIVPRTLVGSAVGTQSIPNIPAYFKHLLLILETRTDVASTSDNLVLRFNADATAANYYTQYFVVSGSTVTAAEILGLTTTGILLPFSAAGSTGLAGNGYAAVWIFNYASSSMRRDVDARCGVHANTTTTNVKKGDSTGFWTNAANPITSITYLPQNGTNIAANSAYTLYGVN